MHFKQYAQYLLNECLQDLASKYLQLLHEAKVPLLQALSTLPEEQQLQQVTKSFQEFLQQVLDNRALEGALQSIDQWHQNKAEIYRIENIQSHDLLLVFSARRKLYIHFLGRYTSDLAIGVKIMEEFEDFTVLVHQQALKAYEQIQQEELTKERNLLESVINNSIDGILAYDSELKIFVFNKVLEQHNGISKADVLGKKLFDIWPSYQDSEEGKAYFKVLAGEHVFLINVPFRLKKASMI